MTMFDSVRALQVIENCKNPDQLRQIGSNARRYGEQKVAHAADLKLYEILPSAQPGSIEYDVWRSIHALEGSLTTERGRTTRLGRTRQKISKVGEFKTVTDLIAVAKKPSEGFSMLIERGMPELTFEAVALRHPMLFDEAILNAAAERLKAAGIELSP